MKSYYKLQLVIFTIFSTLPARGHEACYEESWAYHAGTHTCIKLFQINTSWEEARTYCHQLQLGSQFNISKRLVKIDDEDTNTFVRSLFTDPGMIIWIGLHYVSDMLTFRWDGYPDEIPKFQDRSWARHTRPYVAINMEGWQGENAVQDYYFVCQHRAKTAVIDSCEQQVQPDGINITCRSKESPCPAHGQWTYKYETDSNFQPWRLVTDEFYEETTTNGSISYITVYSAILDKENALIKEGTLQFMSKIFPDILVPDISTNENALSTKSVDIVIARPQKPTFVLSDKNVISPNAIIAQGSIDIPFGCRVVTGSPAVYSTIMSCESPFTTETYNVTRTPQEHAMILCHGMREMDGRKCTCLGYHVTGITEESVLTFKVFSPPKHAICHSELYPDRVEFSCQIDKVYPKFSCDWSCRHENEVRMTSLSGNITTRYSNVSYTDTDGLLYYSFVCSVTMTPDNVDFRDGHMVNQALIYPNIEGITEKNTADAFITIQDTLLIDLPDDAQLVIIGRNVLRASPLVEDESIALSFTVSSGSPEVQSVTLACAFALNDKDGSNEITVRGTNYVISKTVSLEMNGKTCKCIGNHLTGPIQSLPLTFLVVAMPSDVKCTHELRPTGLFSACEIGKVYPEAVCTWSYLNENDLYFRALPTIHKTHYINYSYDNEHGVMYFKTNCSMHLTPEMIEYREGALTVHVTINPNFPGINIKTTSAAFRTTQEIVDIERPDKPTMKAHIKTSADNSSGNQTTLLSLDCGVKSGRPAVHSVTLDCEFPINDVGDMRLTVNGTDYVVQTILSNGLAGKRCTCIGHHLTGSIESSPLVIGTFDKPTADVDSSSNLSTGAIVGLVLATNVVVIGLALLSVRYWRTFKSNINTPTRPTNDTHHTNPGYFDSDQEPELPPYQPQRTPSAPRPMPRHAPRDQGSSSVTEFEPRDHNSNSVTEFEPSDHNSNSEEVYEEVEPCDQSSNYEAEGKSRDHGNRSMSNRSSSSSTDPKVVYTNVSLEATARLNRNLPSNYNAAFDPEFWG